MDSFKLWLNEQEAVDEGFGNLLRKGVVAGTLAASSLFPQFSQAAQPPTAPAPIQQKQIKQDVIEQNGIIYARGFAKMKGDSARARLNAIEVARTNAMYNLAKYVGGSTSSSQQGGVTKTSFSGRVPPFEDVRNTEKDGGYEVVIKTRAAK